MKKVGILTFHRAHNYGAVLQAYALQETLNRLGNECVVINYKQSHIENYYATFSFGRVLSLLLKPIPLLGYIKRIPQRFSIGSKYSSFLKRHINITAPCSQCSIPQDIDTYVIGSDQVWGIIHTAGLDPVFFGEFNHNQDSKIVGYAISSYRESIESICKDGSLHRYVSNFSNLSFREKSIRDMITDKVGVNARVDIDPTLLANSEIWDNIVDKSWADKRYVLFYNLRAQNDRAVELKNKALEVANSLNCEVVDILDPQYGPVDFVSAFKYAQHVITTSFHGTVFSIIFERSLQSVKLNDGHDGRYVDLLNAIGAEQMLVDVDFLPEVKCIDYNPIKERLSNLKEESLNYLSSI